jgi:hypothetical protein
MAGKNLLSGHKALSKRLATLAAGGAVALFLSGAAPAESAAAASQTAAPIPSGAARIWFYRDYEPYGARNMAPVSLNGAVVGYVQPEGTAFYRDVSPGQYHVAVQSIAKDIQQDADLTLAPGQQAFVKILQSNTWESGGDNAIFNNDAFYVRLMPPQIAEAEIAR